MRAVRNTAENRIETLIATVAADMPALSDEERDTLMVRTERTIERLCGVKRSLKAGVEPSVTVHGHNPEV